MNLINVTVNSAGAQEAYKRSPARMRQIIGEALGRGAQEVAREAREKAPKLFSTLTNSIMASRIDDLHWTVQPGVNYARGVEEGTGPAAGKSRYYPNPDSLLQYIRMSPRMRVFEWSRKGSRKRGEQELDVWYRSRAMAWYIFNHGTKANPFMQPAAAAKESRVIELVREAVARGVQEVML